MTVAGEERLVLIAGTPQMRDDASQVRELYADATFALAREYADNAGMRWFAISPKFGLLHPDDVIGPYALRWDDCGRGYREEWGRFVVAQLGRRVELPGATVEVHATTGYVEALRPPLASAGAQLVAPLEGLPPDEWPGWYAGAGAGDDGTSDVTRLRVALTDRTRALSPEELRVAAGPQSSPGIYAWWVDRPGAAELSAGLGHAVAPGLIYLGHAGTAGEPVASTRTTLRGRLRGGHPAGLGQFAAFRRTLAACLRAPLALRSDGDPRLDAWMAEHLAATVVPVPASRRESRTLEEALLAGLDPPLNLVGVPRTPLRTSVQRLRRSR